MIEAGIDLTTLQEQQRVSKRSLREFKQVNESIADTSLAFLLERVSLVASFLLRKYWQWGAIESAKSWSLEQQDNLSWPPVTARMAEAARCLAMGIRKGHRRKGQVFHT